MREGIGEGATVGQALVAWRDELRRRNLKPTTIAGMEARAGTFLPWAAPLATVNRPRWLEARWRTRRDEGAAVATVRGELKAARALLAFAVREGLCRPADIGSVRVLGRANRGKVQLTRTEARAFLDAALARPDGLCPALLLLLGLRPTEARTLRSRAVDPAAWILTVEDAKTPTGLRDVEIPAPLRPHLAPLLDGEWLFPDVRGPAGERLLRRQVWRICDAAGVRRVCPHALRGTHRTLAREAGASGHLVALQLGHAGDRIGEQHYAAPGSEDRAIAARAQDALLGNADSKSLPTGVNHTNLNT